MRSTVAAAQTEACVGWGVRSARHAVKVLDFEHRLGLTELGQWMKMEEEGHPEGGGNSSQ